MYQQMDDLVDHYSVNILFGDLQILMCKRITRKSKCMHSMMQYILHYDVTIHIYFPLSSISIISCASLACTVTRHERGISSLSSPNNQHPSLSTAETNATIINRD